MPNETRSLRVPSYRCHKPSGQAVVTLSGGDVYLGRYGTEQSKPEYQRLVGEWPASPFSKPEGAQCDSCIRCVLEMAE